MLVSATTDPAASAAPRRRYRTIFISDLHLGSRGCKADCLLDFLRHVESDTLYLVGDIVDGWRLKKKWFWPDQHAEVLARLLARARSGTQVIYLPGNHDEDLRRLVGRSVAGVKVRHDMIHHTADGRRLLVVHGDVFDGVVMEWLAMVGSVAYDIAFTTNKWFNMLRRRLGLGYWPLSAFLEQLVNASVMFIDRYERSVAHEARRQSVCGLVCGHVHRLKCERSKGSSTTTMVTGPRAVPPWSSTATVVSSCSNRDNSGASIHLLPTPPCCLRMRTPPMLDRLSVGD